MGRRVTLHSPLPPDEAARRIDRTAGPVWSFAHHGVAGWARFGFVRLVWSIPMFENGFRPVFAGRLVATGKGTRLTASYGASGFLRVFLAVWYGLFGIISASLILLPASTRHEDAGPLLVAAAAMALAAVPIAFHLIFNRKADAHYEEMLGFLAREAKFG
ncbi:hypothetical protein [Erythrobacter sp.]|uniref:hypothetical protein n=1 Tax=Erythrobacter sp. TaxID=1042 RepID=UPI001425D035|nr:hypothetical protein [Erythrobacter sp.]QIQ86745.1 MAG: hypothetical protein G9473_08645 [Erythrobacter sp.]